MQFFPKAQTLIDKHLHQAVESPVIIHYAVVDAPLVLFFGGLVLFLFDDHLLLGKIANDNSPFSPKHLCIEVLPRVPDSCQKATTILSYSALFVTVSQSHKHLCTGAVPAILPS